MQEYTEEDVQQEHSENESVSTGLHDDKNKPIYGSLEVLVGKGVKDPTQEKILEKRGEL